MKLRLMQHEFTIQKYNDFVILSGKGSLISIHTYVSFEVTSKD